VTFSYVSMKLISGDECRGALGALMGGRLLIRSSDVDVLLPIVMRKRIEASSHESSLESIIYILVCRAVFDPSERTLDKSCIISPIERLRIAAILAPHGGGTSRENRLEPANEQVLVWPLLRVFSRNNSIHVRLICHLDHLDQILRLPFGSPWKIDL